MFTPIPICAIDEINMWRLVFVSKKKMVFFVYFLKILSAFFDLSINPLIRHSSPFNSLKTFVQLWICWLYIEQYPLS